MQQQNRRSINLPTSAYEELSFLQAEARLIMKKRGDKLILGKTAMTNVLQALISNTTAEELSELLNKE